MFWHPLLPCAAIVQCFIKTTIAEGCRQLEGPEAAGAAAGRAGRAGCLPPLRVRRLAPAGAQSWSCSDREPRLPSSTSAAAARFLPLRQSAHVCSSTCCCHSSILC